jgi:hypothetical protein
VFLRATRSNRARADKALAECNVVDYSSAVAIAGDVVNPAIASTYNLNYECWPEELRDDYSMVTGKREVEVLATAPGSGCASGRFTLQGHLNIFLCDWGGQGLIFMNKITSVLQTTTCAPGPISIPTTFHGRMPTLRVAAMRTTLMPQTAELASLLAKRLVIPSPLLC